MSSSSLSTGGGASHIGVADASGSANTSGDRTSDASQPTPATSRDTSGRMSAGDVASPSSRYSAEFSPMRAKSGARAARGGGSSHGDEDEPPSQASHSDRSSPGSGAGSPHAGVSAPGGGGAALAEGGSEGDADDGSAEGDEGSASDAAAGAGGDNNSPHHHQDQPSQAPPPHHQAQQDLPAAQSFTSPSHAPRNDRVGQLRAAGEGDAPLTPNSYMTGNTSMFLTPSPTRLPPVVGPTLEDLQQAQTQAEQAQANMETVMRDGQPAAVDASASGGDDSMVDDARNIAMQQLFYAYDEYVLPCVCVCVCVCVCGCGCVAVCACV